LLLVGFLLTAAITIGSVFVLWVRKRFHGGMTKATHSDGNEINMIEFHVTTKM
jgi:hypothetical protein